jgi:hypothetical protein
MKGCATIVAAIFVASLGVAGVTWVTDSCTIYIGSHNANVTLQGWGSHGACQQIENSGASTFASVIHVLTFGRVDARPHEGSPSGNVICDGWNGWQRYTVRDYGGLLGLNYYGHQLCTGLQKAHP